MHVACVWICGRVPRSHQKTGVFRNWYREQPMCQARSQHRGCEQACRKRVLAANHRRFFFFFFFLDAGVYPLHFPQTARPAHGRGGRVCDEGAGGETASRDKHVRKTNKYMQMLLLLSDCSSAFALQAILATHRQVGWQGKRRRGRGKSCQFAI